jgi:hypothetical protein
MTAHTYRENVCPAPSPVETAHGKDRADDGHPVPTATAHESGGSGQTKAPQERPRFLAALLRSLAAWGT